MTWPVATYAALALTLAAGFAWYELARPSSRTVALVATLSAVAALGRVAFAPLPNVKPTVAIALVAGVALGPAPGFVVGAVAALTSNMVLGQGPWTPWQMLAWGLVGVLGAVLGRATGRTPGRVALAAAGGVAGLAFGLIMDAGYSWLTFGGGELGQLWFTLARGLPFDVALALGDVAFCLAFGPALVRALVRFRARSDVRWHPAGATLAAGAVALAVAAAAPAPARAASPLARPLAYLVGAQAPDGGFGSARGEPSSGLMTAWATMGLAAAGTAPASVTRDGHSPVDYLRASARPSMATGDLERTILALASAGSAPADLADALAGRQAADGSFGRLVNLTAFGILALRSAGRAVHDPAIEGAVGWIARQQNRDGGFSFATRGAPSEVDDTAGAVQAIVAAGHRDGTAVRRALRYLAGAQHRDGGFPLAPGSDSNAQSTAWAVQALVAGNRRLGRVHLRDGRTPLAYLRSLVARDGSIRYSATSSQTPVWVTGEALMALARRPFPLHPDASAARAHQPALSVLTVVRIAVAECASLLGITGLH